MNVVTVFIDVLAWKLSVITHGSFHSILSQCVVQFNLLAPGDLNEVLRELILS